MPPALAVPAYFGPWERGSWQALLADAPALVVINPDTGPGAVAIPGYRELVAQLQGSATTVLGYVTTSWGSVALDSCREQARHHVERYGVDGFFWDEIPRGRSTLALLRSLELVGRDSERGAVAFNPGGPIPRSWRYAVAGAWWVSFEGTGAQYLAAGSTRAQRRDWHLVHSVRSEERAAVQALLARRGPGLAFATGDTLANPWDVYPGPLGSLRDLS